jgi:glucose/arabinose dehydrogenase
MRARRALKIVAVSLGVLALAAVGFGVYVYLQIGADPFLPLYAENCAVCHGESFAGSAQGPALVGRPLTHGDTVVELTASIANGFPERGMPGWSAVLGEAQIQSLAILVAEQRVNRTLSDFKTDKPLAIPTAAIQSELARFRIEPVASGIAAKPFAIAPLPDGRILLSEKIEGLSVVAPDGARTRIRGTPQTSRVGVNVLGIDYGLGWLLDVGLHPYYAENGWIYLVHTDLCAECKTDDGPTIPRTMNRLVRGRIRGDTWVDEQVIWSVPDELYSTVPDVGAGGRLALSADGYAFVSVGIKGGYFEGIQDLSKPYGKIHRVHDDGRVPADNPFAARRGAMPSIWTFGHRSPQGLDLDPRTGELWGTEMGPRGGDEVNHLRPGRNYGWPLTSKGVDYDGTPVEYGNDLGITFDLRDIEQPVVDLTPSPAVSSFVFYAGDAFPEWRGQLIVGSLKATELYRFELDGDRLVHSETLLSDLARIRDVALEPSGAILLLLEHETGSRIVRLVREK